ncbi:MAG TPA: hypothetical protein VJQ82_22860 [Terriglobales bacterium]|nr:hypothetical protein [Terriglobales bacterium]
MNPTSSPVSTENSKPTSPAIQKSGPVKATQIGGEVAPKAMGYGLPCAKCRTYYAADLDSCPICHNTERVKAASPMPAGPAAPILSEGETPDPDVLEQERERFLREFKNQMYASQAQIQVSESFRCNLDENHPGDFEAAEVCKGCYDRLQERVDLMEAALHMELKEATQIVYDAVWADTSDTGKTYENAAQALLTEIRKRAGIPAVLGPLQPLSH